MSIDVFSISQISPKLVAEFANRTWGKERAKVILSEWWVNSNHAYTMVAYDNELERIAGIVVAVKSCWHLPNGELSDTVSICGWYVAPEYAGQGLGRVLVKHFNDFTTSRNTLAITKDAVKAFQKLGWNGPFKAKLFLFPLPLIRKSKIISDCFSYKSYKILGNQLPIELCEALDKIDNEAPKNLGRRVRSAKAWKSHLSVWPERRRSMYIIELNNAPIGAFVIRCADKHAAPVYRYSRLSYVTDIIMNNQDVECLSYLSTVIISAANITTGGLVTCTSNCNIAEALSRCGWWSESTPIIGKKIAAKSPLYMLDGELAKISNNNFDITFSDSDIDLNL